MTDEKPRRRSRPSLTAAPQETRPEPPKIDLPYLLDFLPREKDGETRLARFFARLREGRLSTTRCPKDDLLHWPPRTACPRCHTEELAWVDLPGSGTIYAFSAVLAGAPLGMEPDVPFTVGLVDLDGAPLRLFGRIEGRTWADLRIGERVTVESYEVPDGRVFYRFRADAAPATPPSG